MRQDIKYYFSKNALEYLKVFIIFIIGIVISIISINNSNDNQKEDIKKYIDNKVSVIKSVNDYNSGVFVDVLKENLKDFLIFSFLTSTLIGIPIAYFCVIKKGFSIGYTISAIYATQNVKTSIIFICTSMLIHNIMIMMSMFFILVCGKKFVDAILNQNRKNIRFEIFRYIIFLIVSLGIVSLASVFEVYGSTFFMNFCKKYI